jgi:hypothetical protein
MRSNYTENFGAGLFMILHYGTVKRPMNPLIDKSGLYQVLMLYENHMVMMLFLVYQFESM